MGVLGHNPFYMRDLISDLRIAFRGLLRTPGATLFSVAILSMGIGVATAVASLYEGVVLRAWPVHDAGRLVRIQAFQPARAGDAGPRSWDLCPLDVKDLERSPGLLRQPFYFDSNILRVQSANASRSALGVFVSGNYFEALAPRMVQGRGLAHDEPDGAVLSQGLWDRLFGPGTALGGQTVQVSGVTTPVVGVVDRGFKGLEPGLKEDLWMPKAFRSRISPLAGEDGGQHLAESEGANSFAYLKLGISLTQAEASLAGVANQWVESAPADRSNIRLRLEPGTAARARLWERVIPHRQMLFAALGLFGLLGVFNVLNLQLARWIPRQREMATRVALGATRIALLRGIAMEIVLLLGAGFLLAMPTAAALARAFESLQPANGFEMTLDPRIDLPTLGFAALLLVVMGLIFSAIVLAWLSKDRSSEALRVGEGLVSGHSRWHRWAMGLQMALTMGILGVSYPVVASMARVARRDVGFKPKGVYSVNFALPTYLEGQGGAAFRSLWSNLADRLRTHPEFQAVSGSWIAPMEAHSLHTTVGTIGGAQVESVFDTVQPGFLATLGVPMVDGRDFTPNDVFGGDAVAMIDATLAKALWPNGKATGKTVEWRGKPVRVVGVFAPFVIGGPLAKPTPIFLRPQRQSGWSLCTVLARSSLSASRVGGIVESEAAAVDPRLAVIRAEPLIAMLDRQMTPIRLTGLVVGIIGALAMTLSLAGIYGLQRTMAAQRRREIGLRMAFGATPEVLVKEGALEILKSCAPGILVGILVAWVLRGLLSTALGPAVAESGAVTLGALGATLLVAVMTAGLAPIFGRADEPARLLKRE